MLKLKYKIPPFVFGVTIGLLVGIVFFIFKIDDYIKKISKPSIESIKVTEQSMDGLLDQNEDTISNKKLRLSAKKSPTINYSEVDQLLNDDEDFNIAKEELLSVKNIKVIDLDASKKQDTLVGQLAGVINTSFPNLFFVEFWKTPLNSKGYRMTRNRVILYGLSDFSSITIYKVDDNFYLKNDEFVYKISAGTEFKSLEIVSDSELLAKIN
ncbi:MAG: hypothetical protein KA210_08060 [Bacteroidia bacterium]|jgi:hypothetical protein|nr:hypothetical protein [Bacteroidia bacterium]